MTTRTSVRGRRTCWSAVSTSVGRATPAVPQRREPADVRQTKYEPLVLPRRPPDGRWTVDAWAPLDGRVWNGGVRLSF